MTDDIIVAVVSMIIGYTLGQIWRHRRPIRVAWRRWRASPPPLARVIHRADPDARLKLAIGDLGSDRRPDPRWQERVLAAVGRPTAWHRYRIALWIGLAVAGAVVALVGVAS